MRTITACRSCESTKLREVLDLGEQYVSDFRADTSKPNKYPLVGVICEDCLLVQLRDTTPSGEMYHENYGFKSGISNSIKDDLADNVIHALSLKPDAKNWLDIASNDGTLLSFVPEAIERHGIDPIKKLCQEAQQYGSIINDFFKPDYYTQKFDIITSISCFYDMDDPNAFAAGVASVLAPDGVWNIQQNYLLPTIELNAVDNFCHEHLEYYTLYSLESLLDRHGLEVIDVKTSMVNGGSIRTLVAHKSALKVSDSVQAQRDIEFASGLEDLETYEQFGSGVIKQLKELEDLVKGLHADGKTIYIVAASTRGATIWQGANLNETIIPYAIERNPAKVGRYFSALGIPICSEEWAREQKPDLMLVGPWFFAFPEIVEREKEYLMAGGKMIIPLPTIQIVDKGYFQ